MSQISDESEIYFNGEYVGLAKDFDEPNKQCRTPKCKDYSWDHLDIFVHSSPWNYGHEDHEIQINIIDNKVNIYDGMENIDNYE